MGYVGKHKKTEPQSAGANSLRDGERTEATGTVATSQDYQQTHNISWRSGSYLAHTCD